MNAKWTKLSGFAVVLAATSLVALGAPAMAQGTGAAVAAVTGGRGGPMWGSTQRGPQNSLVATAAKQLGMSQTDLVAQLNAGKTIAAVAEDKGVALEQIVDAAIVPRVEAMSAAVEAGRMTQAQADAMIATMKANITAQLSAPWTPRETGMGMPGSAFVDSDGDGVCDNMSSGQPQQRSPGGRWGR